MTTFAIVFILGNMLAAFYFSFVNQYDRAAVFTSEAVLWAVIYYGEKILKATKRRRYDDDFIL